MIDWLLGGSGDGEDEEPELPASPEENDTVITVGNNTSPLLLTHQEEEEDSETSYADDDSESNDSPVERSHREWIDHIIMVTQNLYQEPSDMIRRTYKMFTDAYANEELNLGALEYIRDEHEYNHKVPQQGLFKCIFYNTLAEGEYYRQEPAKILDNIPGVFLVNKQLDFVYGRVIECALLNGNHQLSDSAYELFKQRKQTTKPCVGDHDASEKACPSEWVLYVDVSSPFYTFCSKLLKEQVPYVNFGLTAHYVEAERLSFYLVLFLCGEFFSTSSMATLSLLDQPASVSNIKSEHYTSINQWKKLPVWFLGLWYAAHLNQ